MNGMNGLIWSIVRMKINCQMLCKQCNRTKSGK